MAETTGTSTPRKRTPARKAPTAEKAAQTSADAALSGADAAAETAQTVTKTMDQTLEQTLKMTNKQMEDATKRMEDLADMSRENMEALVASSMAVAKGFEQMGEHFVALSRKQVEDTQAFYKSLTGAKNMKEAFDIQSDFMKSYMEGMMGEMGKLSDAALGISREVAEPITARMSATMDRMGQAA
ncbi:MAG: phasin family protein [Rhodothalassiaceae bacterium]